MSATYARAQPALQKRGRTAPTGACDGRTAAAKYVVDGKSLVALEVHPTARFHVTKITNMHRRPKPVELPIVVSVRFSPPDFQKLVSLADAGRRNLSQTVRLLIESALRADTPTHQFR
jgi:hypothetical protein